MRKVTLSREFFKTHFPNTQYDIAFIYIRIHSWSFSCFSEESCEPNPKRQYVNVAVWQVCVLAFFFPKCNHLENRRLFVKQMAHNCSDGSKALSFHRIDSIRSVKGVNGWRFPAENFTLAQSAICVAFYANSVGQFGEKSFCFNQWYI